MGDRIAIIDPLPNLNAQQIRAWRQTGAGYDSHVRGDVLPVDQGLRPGRPASRSRSRPAATWPASGPATTPSAACTRRPANEVVRGAVDLELQITKGEQDLLNPIGVNCIRAFPGRGIRVWGARTLSSDPAWRYLNVRRYFNYLEESILTGTQWVVFEPNDQALWARVRRNISAFLINEWRGGALFGATRRGRLLRQVRRGDQPAGVGGPRPRDLRDRHRPGQARRVRGLPPGADLRRRQRTGGVASGGPGTDLPTSLSDRSRRRTAAH